MMVPSCIMMRRLPRRMASVMLCVTMSVVRLSQVTISSVILSTFSAVFGSSAAVCSSSRSTFGRMRVAMSRVSACRWPPESRPTFWVIRPSRSSSSRPSCSR